MLRFWMGGYTPFSAIPYNFDNEFACDKPHYPFELPKGWCWCKLYDIVEFIGGYAYKSNTYVSKSDYQVIRIGNVKNDFLNLENLPVFVPETIGNQTDKYRIYENDILFTMTGTKGKRDYFFTTVVIKQEKILLLNQRVGCLRSFSTELNMNYLSMLLKCKYILDSIFSTETGNVSQGNIGSENTLNLFVALPPYVEQQRIVKKVNSFFDLLNVMEERKRNLQDCIHDIKVKILDLAIHGKLVPQDPNDEPATELLKRINPKAEITCDNPHYRNLPFQIPSTWAWCSHNDVLEISGGSQPAKRFFSSVPQKGYVRLYQIRDYGENPIPVYIPIEYAMKRTEEGDILLARYGGSLGKVFHAKKGAYNVAMAKVIFKDKDLINKEYAYFYYLSDLYQGRLKEISRTAQAGFNSSDFNEMYFPLPPYEEQQRIVNAINKAFTTLDVITENL